MVGSYVASLPRRHLPGEGSTNLIAKLKYGNFNCAGGTRIVIITDGVESSSEISARQLLAGKPLPRPEKGFLSGCEVVMYGLGQSANGEISNRQVDVLRDAWRAWMKAAGAKFDSIVDP